MLTFFRRFSLIFISVATITAHAGAATDLSSMLERVKSMKANFTQTTYNARGRSQQVAYGRMALLRPGKFRWEVLKPMPQLIIANQSTLWVYDPDLEQVTIRSLNKATGETTALFLSNNEELDQHYAVKVMEKNQSQWQWFLLTPKKADAMFESIQMGFTNDQIHEMRLKDNLGNNTVIQFQKILSNPSLASNLFTFKPPARVDVIDETRKK